MPLLPELPHGCRESVADIACCQGCFRPEVLGEPGVRQHGSNALHNGAVQPLCCSVPFWCVAHTCMMHNAFGSRKGRQLSVDELGAVVASDGFDARVALLLQHVDHVDHLIKNSCLVCNRPYNQKRGEVIWKIAQVEAAAEGCFFEGTAKVHMDKLQRLRAVGSRKRPRAAVLLCCYTRSADGSSRLFEVCGRRLNFQTHFIALHSGHAAVGEMPKSPMPKLCIHWDAC